MPDLPTTTEWAQVRFPPSREIEVPQRVVEHVAEVYRRQAADSDRFASAAPSIMRRLDLGAGAVVGMTCDRRFAQLVENWVTGCDRAGIEVRSRTIVFTTDDDAARRIDALGLVVHYDEQSEALAAMRPSRQYGDRPYVDYMYHQNWAIHTLLDLGVDVLFQDVDLVWRHDPLPLLRDQAAAGADVQAMYDGPNPRFQPLYANSGFLYFRRSDRVRAFWDEVFGRHDMVGAYRSQQEPLDIILAVYAARGLRVVLLDEERFANGHLYCGGRTPPSDPWVVHHSWTPDLDTKFDRYLDNGHWYLDPPERHPNA